MGNSIFCCSDRDKDEELKASIGRKKPWSSKQIFRVVLKKTDKNDFLGIQLSHDKNAIQVRGIANGSLAHEWNLMNPTLEIRERDRVVSVNGVEGRSQQLVDVLRSADTVDLVVKRRFISPDMLEGYWRTGGREYVFIQRSKARFAQETWDLSVQSDNIIATDMNGETYKGRLLESELHWDDDVWVRDWHQYCVDNSILKATSKGMAYQTTPDVFATASEEEAGFARWGTTLCARDLENGWVCLQEGCYLPTHVDGVRVLIPVDEAPAAGALPD